jgi:isoleucyl-tRNA synthetase
MCTTLCALCQHGRCGSENILYRAKDRDEIDKWLLSKYNKLAADCTEAMDDYDMTTTVRKIQQFVNEDLSNWYIKETEEDFGQRSYR